MNTSGTSNTVGFTLLEILVAVFILTIVISTIFSTFTETIDNMNYTESQADIYQMARITLDRMQEDLACSLIPQSSRSTPEEEVSGDTFFLGQNGEIDERDADRLSFVSTTHLSFEDTDIDSGLARIAYYVKKDDDDEGFMLYRSDTPEQEQPPDENTGGYILSYGLFSVNIVYYDADGDEYENWDSSSVEFKDILPSMIRIQLSYIDVLKPENPYKFETGISLPLAKGVYGKASKK